jgi:Na+-translocating ferredoxin:NAD+ oxidoreductase RnfC subunit
MSRDIVEAVRVAGVVGAGGAGFPAHVKIAARVDTVIANGAECDPLLQCDQRLMESRAAEMVRGVQLAMEATGATRGILALKEEYEAAAAALQRAIRPLEGRLDLGLLLMESRYPAGDEFVLVHRDAPALDGRRGSSATRNTVGADRYSLPRCPVLGWGGTGAPLVGTNG